MEAREREEGFGRLLESVCEQHGWEVLPSGVKLELPDGRRQVVAVETFDFEGEPFVRLSSGIGDAEQLSPARLEAALRLNAELAYGALAIRDGEIAMVATRRVKDVRPEDLGAVLRSLAETADWYEKVVFGTDEN